MLMNWATLGTICPVRVQLLHLDGTYRGRTVTYEGPVLTLGTAPDADIRYSEGVTVKPHHAEIRFYKEACNFHLKALEGEVFVNHREVEEVVLEPNDLIEIGRLGPKLRFRVYATRGPVCKPVLQMLHDAREVAHVSGVWEFSRAVRRDLNTHATRRLKLGTALIALLIGFGVANLGNWMWTEHTAREQERLLLQQEARHAVELERLRTRLEEYQREQAASAKISRDEVERMRRQISRHTAVVDDLVSRSDALKQVLNVYSGGVCLLHGIFTFRQQRRGRMVTLRGGDGKPLSIDYVGSGFLASKEGHIVTNRHVAEPWWKNRRVDALVKLGWTPMFVRLDASFPNRDPIEVDPATIRISPDGVDIAVMRVDVTDVPVLPLFKGDPADMRGSHVILLGYPTGIGALLARADEAVVARVLAKAPDSTAMIAALAAGHAISPVITQGALNEVKSRRLVYDADTTEGGSGGPVFVDDGTVIGVNYAITRNFSGSNYGVPIEFARKLLP